MPARYHVITRILHWLMAFGFLMMLVSGLYLEYGDPVQEFEFKLYGLHKAGGVLLLIAFAFRLVAKLVLRAPAKLDGLSNIERKVSTSVHHGFYILMLLVPLSGWVMVSAGAFAFPINVYGLFEWPLIGFVEGNDAVEDGAENAHGFLAKVLLAVIILHVAGALKHQFIDRSNILSRMGFGKS